MVSLTITGFYCSYFLPAAFLLYHRVKGHIAPHGSAPDHSPDTLEGVSTANSDFNNGGAEGSPDKLSDTKKVDPPSPDLPAYTEPRRGSVSVVQAQLVWGPFHLPGIFGIINNAYACVYMIFVIFWSVWPPGTPVTASTMNYSVVVTGGIMILSIVWYWVRGRKEYHGPLIDDEVARIMRAGSIVEV